jgi:DNA-binding response OmpR family regulator
MNGTLRNNRTAASSGKVLLLSNDPELSSIWAFALQQMGLSTSLVTSTAEAMEQVAQGTFDLMLIDVYGPDLDGIEVTRQVRSQAGNPILLFTPDREEPHMLEAYRAGVDECIVKPVSPPLFMAKVRAWLRRSWTVPAQTLGPLQAGSLRLNPARREVITEAGLTIRLTNLEFRVLHLLMCHRGQVLPSDLIVDRVWGYDGGGDSALLKNVVYRLQRKIEPDSGENGYLQTVAGEGYIFCSS